MKRLIRLISKSIKPVSYTHLDVYKRQVYWEDGAQITPPHDVNITDAVLAITDYADAKTMDKDEAVKAGLYVQIGKDVDDKYIAALKKQVKHQDAIDAVQKDIKIVYTPLHGRCV